MTSFYRVEVATTRNPEFVPLVVDRRYVRGIRSYCEAWVSRQHKAYARDGATLRIRPCDRVHSVRR